MPTIPQRAAGWRIVFTRAAEVVYNLGSSMTAPGVALEYNRSHLRFYAKHHGWATRLLLRGGLAARGGLGWLTARGPENRRASADLIRLALRGR